MIRTYSDAHSLICLPVPSHIKSLFRVSEGAKFIGNRSGTPSFCDFLFFTRRGGSIMPAAWQLDTLCTLRFIAIRADSDWFKPMVVIIKWKAATNLTESCQCPKLSELPKFAPRGNAVLKESWKMWFLSPSCRYDKESLPVRRGWPVAPFALQCTWAPAERCWPHYTRKGAWILRFEVSTPHNSSNGWNFLRQKIFSLPYLPKKNLALVSAPSFQILNSTPFDSAKPCLTRPMVSPLHSLETGFTVVALFQWLSVTSNCFRLRQALALAKYPNQRLRQLQFTVVITLSLFGWCSNDS